jgi:hypothetical protein
MSQVNSSALISQIRSEIEELHAIAASYDSRLANLTSFKLTSEEMSEIINLTNMLNSIGFELEGKYEMLEELGVYDTY